MLAEIQEKINRTGMIPLSAETLPLIKAGMYWYEDDEVSEKFVADKPLKSVVLSVRVGNIIGDGFEEKEVAISDLFSLAKPETMPLSVFDLSLLVENIAMVNRALDVAKCSLWDGLYLTASDYACYRRWLISFPTGNRSATGRGGTAKIRKTIEYCVV